MDGRTHIQSWFNRDTAVGALELGLNAFMWVGMAVIGLALALGF